MFNTLQEEVKIKYTIVGSMAGSTATEKNWGIVVTEYNLDNA